jgi:hypothetical protein
MFKRLFGALARTRQEVNRAEAHLARLVSIAEANAAKQAEVAARIELKLRQLDQLEIHLGRIEHQLALSHPRFASPLRLERFGRKLFSQNDEDGIIAEIFRRIGAKARVFVEIAAGDGRENCSAALLSQGWRGLWVECDADNVRSIHERWPTEIASGQLKVSSKFLQVEEINRVISDAGLGDDIDLLIMDIDGNDYYMLEALESRPRVICSEYFAKKPPPVSWIMPRDDRPRPFNFTDETGASLQSLDDLLTPRGYSLVGSSIAGVNCFFVRSDLVGEKFEAPFTAYNHYNPPRYWYFTLSFLSAIWPGPPDGAPPKSE